MNRRESAVGISASEIPAEALSSPSLLFLYHRIEQILGIKAAGEALIKLNEYLEKYCKAPFVENPAAFEYALNNQEQIYQIAKTVTVNETYFFREGAHFDLLLSLLPQLAMLKRPLRICSAAASIGCEAYSIAMLLDHYSKSKTDFEFELDAFDISANAVETAKKARYSANTLREDGAGWKHILDLYLLPDGDEYVVSQDIRGKVRFFTHNIMQGLNRQYDVIFFRNALIYFSSENRLLVLNNLTNSLFNSGLLFMGVSETSTVKHPLLGSRYASDIFYFQKIFYQDASSPFNCGQEDAEQHVIPDNKKECRAEKRKPGVKSGYNGPNKDHDNSGQTKPVQPKRMELPVDCREAQYILETEEGQPNSKKVMGFLSNTENKKESEIPGTLSGAELAASVVYFLGIQDFDSADFILRHLEKLNSGACVLFLRGEYQLLRGSGKEAEQCFELAAAKEKAFWPSFYRMAALAAEGNPARYEYKIKKARESLKLGRDLHYECFMGGFSPDYFERLLNQKIQALRIHDYEPV